MKNIMLAFLSSAILTGCAALDWKTVYNGEDYGNDIQISQYSTDVNENGPKKASFSFIFNNMTYEYPYKLEKFYHVLYFIGAHKQEEESSIEKVYSSYPITAKKDEYSFVIKFKEKKSIAAVVQYFHSKVKDSKTSVSEMLTDEKINENIKTSENDFYEVVISSSEEDRKIKILISDFDLEKENSGILAKEYEF